MQARPRSSRVVVAVLLGLMGATFVGQGLGFIPGSFMTGDPFWAVVGAILLAGAVVIGAAESRPR